MCSESIHLFESEAFRDTLAANVELLKTTRELDDSCAKSEAIKIAAAAKIPMEGSDPWRGDPVIFPDFGRGLNIP